jgi:hypothetical protein
VKLAGVGNVQRPASNPSHSFAVLSIGVSAWARGISIFNGQPCEARAVAEPPGIEMTSKPRRRKWPAARSMWWR